MNLSDYVVFQKDENNELVFINLISREVEYSLFLDIKVYGLAVAADQSILVGASYGPYTPLSKCVVVIDLLHGAPQILEYINVEEDSIAVALTPNHEYVLLPYDQQEGNHFKVLNLITHEVQYLDVLGTSAFAPQNSSFFMGRFYEDRIRKLLIDGQGGVIDTKQQSMIDKPLNLVGTSDGNFLFVVAVEEKKIKVVDISNPNYFGVASEIMTEGYPSSIVVNRNNDKIFVLEHQLIQVYDFNPVSKRLTLIQNIQTDYYVPFANGINFIVLAPDEQSVIFHGSNENFNTYVQYSVNGQYLGNFLNVVTWSQAVSFTGRNEVLPHNTVFVTDSNYLLMIDAISLQEIGRVNLGVSLFAVAITHNQQKAIVTTNPDTHEIIELDLTVYPPVEISRIVAPAIIQGLIITLDNRYGIIYGEKMFTYDIDNHILKAFDVILGPLALNYKNENAFYAGIFSKNLLYRYGINSEGDIGSLHQFVSTGPKPISCAPTFDGNFLFVNDFAGNRVEVFDTSNPNYFGYTSSAEVPVVPHTVIVSDDNEFVYVLNYEKVMKFSFNPISKRLTLVLSFTHYTDLLAFGVDLMILDSTNTRLFIVGNTKVSVWSTEGIFIGENPTIWSKNLALYR